jgi:hypothetical protein
LTDKYEATDEDVPWKSGERIEDCFKRLGYERKDKATDAEIAALWEFPVRKNELTKSQERSLKKDHAQALIGVASRKVYVKNAKKQQMYTWLSVLDLQMCFYQMNSRELGFCAYLLRKFQRYGTKTKWLTQSQFDWLRQLAGRYLIENESKNFSGLGASVLGNRWRSNLLSYVAQKDAFRVLAHRRLREESKE